MESRTITVEVEEYSLNNYDQQGDEERTHNINLRRARTDVQMSRRTEFSISKRHSYSGYDYTMPSKGDYLGNAHHYGTSRRPSAWFNTVMARRRRGVTPHSEQDLVDEITEAMEGDTKFMSDDVDGEIMRKETVRELSKPLRVKKEIRRRLTARRSSTRATSRNISGFQHLKYTLSMYWYKVSQSVRDTFHDYSLWHKELKEIEGTFGTGVGSYFRFLRYLFILNLFIAVLVCGFILTPQLLQRTKVTETTTVSESSRSLRSTLRRVNDRLLDLNITERANVDNETGSVDENESCKTPPYGSFGGMDWLTGAGWFNNTELYYGTYTNCSVSLVEGQEYNMPEAYFFTIFIAFIVYLVIILRRVIVLYKNNYIDAEHDVTATFVNKIFSSWDFNITQKKAAVIKHKSIYNDLTELLQEMQGEELLEDTCARVMGYTVKMVFWVVVMGFLGLIGWVMYLMLDKDIAKDVESSGFGLLVYPLIVTLIMMIVPALFEGLVNIEGYKIPRHKLYVTLVRTIILELTILGVLVGFWYLQVPADTGNVCWETSLGQEIYRLLIIDFIVALVIQLAIILFFVATHTKDLGRAHSYLLEFNVARNTLHLVYNQTLLWAGLFFCPLTPLIVVLKMTVMFYIQKFTVLKFLRSDDRPWRAAQTETVFFALTLLSLMLAFISYMFITVRGGASSDCGPFRNYTNYMDLIWSLTEEKQTVLVIISWILKPGVVAFILGVLILLVYCAKSMAEGRAEMIKVLRQQLELEMRDRAFLLQLTEKVRKGEYKPTVGGQIQHLPRDEPVRSSRSLTQKGSFIFTDNKAYPNDSGPRHRFFTDSSESLQESQL